MCSQEKTKEAAELDLLLSQRELHIAEKEKVFAEKIEIELRSKWYYRWWAWIWNVIKSITVIFTLFITCYNVSILVDKKKVEDMKEQNIKMNDSLVSIANLLNVQKSKHELEKTKLEADKVEFQKMLEKTKDELSNTEKEKYKYLTLNKKHEELYQIGHIALSGVLNIQKKANPDFYAKRGPNKGAWGNNNRGSYQGEPLSKEEMAQIRLLDIYECVKNGKNNQAVDQYTQSKDLLKDYLNQTILDSLYVLLNVK